MTDDASRGGRRVRLLPMIRSRVCSAFGRRTSAMNLPVTRPTPLLYGQELIYDFS